MNLIAPSGSLIVCDYEDKVLVEGKYYVIKVGDRATFKRYRSNPDRFEPYSILQEFETIFPPPEGVEIVGRVVLVTHELL